MAVKPQPDEVCGHPLKKSNHQYQARHPEFLQLAQSTVLPLGREHATSEPLILFLDVLERSKDKRQHQPQTVTRKFGTISGSTSTSVKGTFRKQRIGLRMPSFSDPRHSTFTSPTLETVVPRTQGGALNFRTILVHVLRILLFLPWCAAVGGALLLFPSYVELVAFRPGYLESPKGIRRFAHWAECGQQHVMIFLACLVAALWYNFSLGISLSSIVMSRLVFMWHGFKVDKSIPLGEDDQQSLYLIIMGLVSMDGSFSVNGTRGEQT
ncbi:hypothetical protein OG21DRAFT_1514930 [Imleria badia]|nr:hypothetical protein OG21DRAFT_1514930 [Imleria badia]